MAKLLSLGLASIPAPARPAERTAGPEMQEYGATGTSLIGGFLSDSGEYNPNLAGTAAFATYEKMRRSDAQVAATLLAMKLPIRAAEWTVQAPAEATPVEEEAADFVREILFEDIDWDNVVANALLMLDFGCACHEDVYKIDGNRVRLQKLAPRLPVTFYRWITAEGSEDLVAIEQSGVMANGSWGTATVPMSKAALFTFDKEGGNWAGRSVMRPMYRHWYVKDGLYRVDAIAAERNGMGVPSVTLGQGATKEDIALAKKWVQQICAHERAGLVLPTASTFDLVGVKGQVRDVSASIAHHNQMISMAGLAMFLQLGQSESGNRALGGTMSDFFHQSLQATANRIGRVMRLTTVSRLVEWNFGVGVRPPMVVPAQIVAVKFETIVDALQKLSGSGAVTADSELEKWLRGRMGLPSPAEHPKARETQSAKPGEMPDDGEGAGQDAGSRGGEGVGGREPGTPSQNAKPGEKVGGRFLTIDDALEAFRRAGQKLAASDAGPTVDGVRVLRMPGTLGSERGRRAERCLALSEIVGELDRGRDEVAAALRAARSRIQAELVNKLVNTPVRDLHRVTVPPDAKLVAAVEAALERVSSFGAQQVTAERARQRAGSAPEGAAQIRAANVPGRKKQREPLGVYADGVVGEFTNNLTARATNVALDWMRRPGDLTKGEIIRKVEEELDGRSDKWVDPVASKGVNEAFSDGRRDGYEEHRDEIQAVYYSAMLDINCCENCAAADGAEGATPDDIPDAPNPDCDGGDRCRCVHVFVFSDEARGAA